MKRKFLSITNEMNSIEPYEGESIEGKVARIVENNEPITDGAPIVYTKRSEGIKPEFDIRTDKWALAQEKMEKVNGAKRTKIQEKLKATEEPKTEEPKTEEPKTEN